MIESIYNFCLFYKFKPLKIINIHIYDIFILADNNFTSNKISVIKATKIISQN